MLNWKAIIAGAVVDFVGTFMATMALATLWMVVLAIVASPGDDVREMIGHSALYLAVSCTVGWYFDYLGGKVAGTLAGDRGVVHGFAAAMPGVVFGLAQASDGSGLPYPAWFLVLSCVVSIGCACYGGAVAPKR